MSNEKSVKNYLKRIGKKGGKAGKGINKKRGNSEYYSKLRSGKVDLDNKYDFLK